jgi:hypothetical protein
MVFVPIILLGHRAYDDPTNTIDVDSMDSFELDGVVFVIALFAGALSELG